MPDWFLDWSGEIGVIVASGPSAKDHPFEAIKERAKFIAVNNSWKLVPWADVLLGADGGWWQRYKGVPDFGGLKVTLDMMIARQFNLKLLKLLKTHRTIVSHNPGVVGMGGNSGFYAINLAVQFGCKRIVLVGFDMQLNDGTHWHGPHEKGLNNPVKHRLQIWADALDKEAANFKKLGIEVINASASSALKAYPKMGLLEAINHFQPVPARQPQETSLAF